MSSQNNIEVKKLLLVEILLTISFMPTAEGPVKTYRNPVVSYSLPNPSVIRAEDGYFCLHATEDIRNLPIHRSKDLIKQESVGTVSTDEARPTSEPKGNSWIPDINKVGDKYVLYYSTSCWGGKWACGIGAATADKPEGSFVGHGMTLRSSEIGIQNSIDPFHIEDGGRKYILWGNFRDTYGIELIANGLKVKSGTDRKQIVGTTYEGTYIHKKNGYYYLFVSIEICCEGSKNTYQIIVGHFNSLWGPYLGKQGRSMFDNNHAVLIHNNKSFVGIGHNAELITDKAGSNWTLYHGVNVSNPYGRVSLLDRVDWKEG